MNPIGIAAVILQLFFFIVLARVIMSWIPLVTNKPLDYNNPIVKFLVDVTEPVLAPMRRFLTIGMIDLSPMVLLIGLSILQSILVCSA